MTIIDLTSKLIEEFPKVPVFYNHVVVEEGQELNPPYIVTNSEGINPFHADNCNYYTFVRNTVDLYLGTLTEKTLLMLDKFFVKYGIRFDKNESFDEFAYLYQIEYVVYLDEVEEEVTEDGNGNT